LKEGQEKSVSTDRVILIPGPPEEGKAVREVFGLYISKRYSPAAIAAVLNKRGILWVDGAKWTRYVIRDMVTNPKYLVSNRRSGKLQSRRTWNPPEMWIRRDGAFPGLIDAKLFQKAQDVAARRVRTYSNEGLLQFLRDFLSSKGDSPLRQFATMSTCLARRSIRRDSADSSRCTSSSVISRHGIWLISSVTAT
jgi:hypothetical protein